MKISLIWCAFLAVVLALPASAMDSPSTGLGGSILASLSNGDIAVYTSDGVRVRTLHSLTDGQAKGMTFGPNGTLYVAHWYGIGLSGNTVAQFDSNGNLMGEFGDFYNCNPTSVAFDSSGNVYVGQADCRADVLKFDSSGNLLASFDVPVDFRGSEWIAIGSDPCKLFYTSQSANVRGWNVCTNTSLPNFNKTFLSNDAHQLLFLPDGGMLVATKEVIERLDSAGFRTQLYGAVGENGLLGAALDPDNKTFWASSWRTAMIYHFDLATGALLGSFNSGTGNFTVKSLLIVPTKTTAPAPPPPHEVAGRMTGGGSVFNTEGKRVTHGFELHCDASDLPNRLQINWRHNRFHLLTLTSSSCSNDPAIEPENPDAPFDTLIATGTGRYNGVDGATIYLKFTDAGEPGVHDRAEFVIYDSAGHEVVRVEGDGAFLRFGNHQAHKARP